MLGTLVIRDGILFQYVFLLVFILDWRGISKISCQILQILEYITMLHHFDAKVLCENLSYWLADADLI